MYNPITIIQTVWKWLIKTFSSITTFSKLKFFFVSILLVATSWYYIKCYQTPIYQLGHTLHFFASEPQGVPQISLLSFRFDYNSPKKDTTCALLVFDTIRILPQDTHDSIKNDTDIFCRLQQDKYKDTTWFGVKQKILIPHRQPYLFKTKYFEVVPKRFLDNNLVGLEHLRLPDVNHEFSEKTSYSEYWYSTDEYRDSMCVIPKNGFYYPIICNPQWLCRGNLSTFIISFNQSGEHKGNAPECIYEKISFEFSDYIDIVTITPFPDSVWTTGFAYTNSQKLSIIQQTGIDGFCKYPSMEAWQIVRTFALTTLLASLITIFFGMLYNLINRHQRIKSFIVNTLSSIIVSFFIYSIVYADYVSFHDAMLAKHWLMVILHILLFLTICLISYHFLYHVCKKFSISVWAYYVVLCICVFFSKGTLSLTDSNAFYYDNLHEKTFNTLVFIIWFSSVILPGLIYSLKDSPGAQIRKRFSKIYGTQLTPSYMSYKNARCFLIWFGFIYIIFLLTSFIECRLILLITIYCIIYVILTIIKFSRYRKKWEKMEIWKGLVRISVAAQSIFIGITVILVGILYLKKSGNLDEFTICLPLMLTLFWITPYFYKPMMTCRYAKYTRKNRKLQQRKYFRRCFVL